MREGIRSGLFLSVLFALLLAVLPLTACDKTEPEADVSTTAPSVTIAADIQTTAEQTIPPTPTQEPTPTPIPLLKEGSQGPEVMQMQESLINLGYLTIETATEYFGSATKAALMSFQNQNGLAGDGIAGPKTLEILYSGTAKACDPFSKLAPTVNMSFAELVLSDDGTRNQYPDGFPSADTYKIIVDIAHQVTMIYTKDADGNHTIPHRYMLCSTGVNDCTPKGTFKMDKYHVRFSQFVRDKSYGQYWTQIRGAIYFHTILYDNFDTSTYREEIWNRLGTADSHGCVRLTVPDAKWMWFNIAPGTVCVIRDGDPNDSATAAIRSQLKLAELPEERLVMNPADIPNTDNWRIDDIPHDVPFVQGSQN